MCLRPQRFIFLAISVCNITLKLDLQYADFHLARGMFFAQDGLVFETSSKERITNLRSN